MGVKYGPPPPRTEAASDDDLIVSLLNYVFAVLLLLLPLLLSLSPSTLGVMIGGDDVPCREDEHCAHKHVRRPPPAPPPLPPPAVCLNVSIIFSFLPGHLGLTSPLPDVR